MRLLALMLIGLFGVLCLPAQHAEAGYADGMNQYAAYHVMHGGVDPSGMLQKVAPGPSQGARSYMNAQVNRYKTEYANRYVFYDVFKYGTAIDTVMQGPAKTVGKVRSKLVKIKFSNVQDPQYDGAYQGGTIHIPHGGATPEELIHEAWHAYLDMYGIDDNILNIGQMGEVPPK